MLLFRFSGARRPVNQNLSQRNINRSINLKLICTNQVRVYHGRTQAREERKAGNTEIQQKEIGFYVFGFHLHHYFLSLKPWSVDMPVKLVINHPSGLTKEQRTETMDPSP